MLQLKKQILDFQSRVSDLMQRIDDQTSEMETLRKKVNREASLSNGVDSKALSPKSESSNREEVAGLKYVVVKLFLFNRTESTKAHRSRTAKGESVGFTKN